MRFSFSWILIILLMTTMGVGKVLYEQGTTEEELLNVSTKLVWNETLFQPELHANMMNISTTERVIDIVYVGIDAAGDIAFRFAQWGMIEGYKNPTVDYIGLVRLFIWIILIGILLAALPTVLAILYLIYVGIKKIYRYCVKNYKQPHKKKQ